MAQITHHIPAEDILPGDTYVERRTDISGAERVRRFNVIDAEVITPGDGHAYWLNQSPEAGPRVALTFLRNGGRPTRFPAVGSTAEVVRTVCSTCGHSDLAHIIAGDSGCEAGPELCDCREFSA